MNETMTQAYEGGVSLTNAIRGDQTMLDRSHVDTATGVDFERAKARLGQLAGQAFRAYRAARSQTARVDGSVEVLRDEAQEAQLRYRQLKPDQRDEIAAILG